MTDDERAIRDVVDTWMEASRRGDHATVLSLMTQDVVFMVPGRAPFGREVFEAAAKEPNPPKVDGKSEVLEVQVMGGWAWIRNRLEITVTPPGGQPMHKQGYTLTLLRKEADGKWRLARDANLVT